MTVNVIPSPSRPQPAMHTAQATKARACTSSGLHVALALTAATVISAAQGAEHPRADDARALLTHYKCYICHADRETKAGPSYADVAARFRGNPKAVSEIALELRRGLRRGGPWHMPPHPEVSVAESRTMARYIMSLAP